MWSGGVVLFWLVMMVVDGGGKSAMLGHKAGGSLSIKSSVSCCEGSVSRNSD